MIQQIPQQPPGVEHGKTPGRKGREERDPHILELQIVKSLFDQDKVNLLSELSDRERRWMARHKGFIKLMTTPLYTDRLYNEGEIINDPNSQVLTIDDKKIVRKWSGPVFLEEANYWYLVYSVNKDRKGRGEVLTALGRLGGNLMGFLKGNKFMTGEEDQERIRNLWNLWGLLGG